MGSTFWRLTRRISMSAAAAPMAMRTGRLARQLAALCCAWQGGATVVDGIVPGYLPDVAHAHDWQAALTPAYIRFTGQRGVPTVLTVHNMAFQGKFPAGVFGGLGLPPHAMTVDGVEYYGGVGYLKAGLQLADAITTVSPTYAAEIRTPSSAWGSTD
jgi:starch synthase